MLAETQIYSCSVSNCLLDGWKGEIEDSSNWILGIFQVLVTWMIFRGVDVSLEKFYRVSEGLWRRTLLSDICLPNDIWEKHG